jgi:hypothetical protein
MNPGRKTYAPLNGIARMAFSASPLTRAHIVRLLPVLSEPVPDTNTNVIAGFAFTSARAAATARSTVTRR